MLTVRLARPLATTTVATTLTLIAATLSGCGYLGQAAAAPPCVVDIDVTFSVRSAGMLEPGWFTPFVAQVAAGCPTQPLHASLIGNDSQAGTCPPVNLAEVPTNGNPTHDDTATASRRTDLARQLKALMECGLAHPSQAKGTDLFGAFVRAGHLVANRPDARLYILSDMVEQAGRWKFPSRAFDRVDNNRLLADVAHAGLVPAGLAGTTVTVVGANVGAFSIPPDQLAGMDRFWHAYFHKAEATLSYEDSAVTQP
jgi:hypothetical protein